MEGRFKRFFKKKKKKRKTILSRLNFFLRKEKQFKKDHLFRNLPGKNKVLIHFFQKKMFNFLGKMNVLRDTFLTHWHQFTIYSDFVISAISNIKYLPLKIIIDSSSVFADLKSPKDLINLLNRYGSSVKNNITKRLGHLAVWLG
jgi:hypothetical protein